MAEPDPTVIAPWYLRNINQALALDEATGNVFLRTGIEGNIIITGNVSIPGTITVDSSPENPVHTHLNEVGTSGILNVPYMPVAGNVVITSGNINSVVSGTVSTTQGTSPWIVSGNVNATLVEPAIVSRQSFNNFGIFTHRGWTMSDTLIPMLSVRAKTTSSNISKIISYEIGNGSNPVIGYTWIANASITGSLPAWNNIGADAEFCVYTDAYDGNTPNGFTGGYQCHSGIIVGKNSSSEDEMENIEMIANETTLTLCVMRLDSSTKADVWFTIDVETTEN